MDQIFADLLTAVAPIVAETIVGVVVLGVGALYSRVAKTQMDAASREALHSALMTGATVALSRSMSTDEKIQAVTDYARASVPDAIARLKPQAEVLRDLALAKIENALSGR